jgi:hypothetical protein
MSNPNEMIPIARRPERLGIGVRSVNGLYARAKRDPAFPPIWKFKGRNHVMAADLERYRQVLAERKAAQEARRNGP